MARVTRSQKRKAGSPSPAATVPSSVVTPVFSVASQDNSAEPSPATSDIDDEPLHKKARTALDNDEVEITSTQTRPRIVANRAYVEIKTSRISAKAKGKQKAVTLSPSPSPEPPSIATSRPRRAASTRTPTRAKLEYEEEPESSPLSEEDQSGSAFEQDEAADSEDDELMLSVGISNSLQPTPTAGSSSRPRKSDAALRAAAAEQRRRKRLGATEDEVDSDYDDKVDLASTDDEQLEGGGESDDSDTPLATQKGDSKAKTNKPKALTLKEIRRQKADGRKRKKDPYIASEERALRKKLGRKLTHAEKTTIALQKYHPELKDVWGDLEAKIQIITPVEAEQPKELKVTLLPFQRESLSWMREQEKGVWKGGMLADEMGMGKTIQIISLLVSDRKRPNLVVAPTVAVMQWRNEIATHTDGMKVLVWHGSGRASNSSELEKYDVVLTTYAVLESCFRKQEKGFARKGKMITEDSPVHKIKWRRIILDEAHNIKERSTNTAKACFELKSDVKWCLSGTPLQNRVGELYSLIRFLGGDPFSFYFCKACDCKSLHWQFVDHKYCKDCGHGPMQHTCLWNNEILTPIQKNGMVGPGQTAFKKLKILLDRMMLRRTKVQKADDLGLPPRIVVVRRDHFSPEEKELYTSLYSDVKRQFGTYLEQGTVLNNYSNIFSLLTRMRQMACHPDLVLRSKTNAAQFVPGSEEATVCRLCNDIAEDAIQARCRHIFDRECIKQYLEAALEQVPGCPICHVPLTIDLDAPALDIDANVSGPRQGILGRLNIDTWRSSTKIEALVEDLSNLRLQDSTTKSIVFSQFVSFLDLIDFRLKRAGFNVCRLEGTMSPQARDATIQHFMSNVDVTVFLVSLKAGGVALNLTEASRVYLCDSWWNPAVEYQAMDRIHRLGQHRPVQAIKLVIEDSIESRIVQLQEKKAAMINATLSTDDSAMGRLTPQDLAFLFKL